MMKCDESIIDTWTLHFSLSFKLKVTIVPLTHCLVTVTIDWMFSPDGIPSIMLWMNRIPWKHIGLWVSLCGNVIFVIIFSLCIIIWSNNLFSILDGCHHCSFFSLLGKVMGQISCWICSFSSVEGELFLQSWYLKLVLILSYLHAPSSSIWLVYPFLKYLHVCLVKWYQFLFG